MSAPRIKVDATEYTTKIRGTRHELILYGYATPEMFPEGRSRRKVSDAENSPETWIVSLKNKKDGIYEVCWCHLELPFRGCNDFTATMANMVRSASRLVFMPGVAPELSGEDRRKLLEKIEDVVSSDGIHLTGHCR